jgi:hypothetical protein
MPSIGPLCVANRPGPHEEPSERPRRVSFYDNCPCSLSRRVDTGRNDVVEET